MAKGNNQKLKLLYLAKILMEKTDEEHGLTMPEIIKSLQAYGVDAERKTIYADLEELRLFGMDILCEQEGKKYYYHIGEREFELAELKLLVDSVQSAKFITEKKSQELIKKLEGLVSIHEAKQLHRQVYISGRIKTMNESIYYNVDKIHTAIGSGVQIRFQYYQWNVKKEMELRHDGAWYLVSPWGLLWDDEYYYMVAYDKAGDMLKHYRVDKMLHIEITDITREGKERFAKFSMPSYSKRLFGMFDGEEQMVKIECTNDLAGVMIDRFGKDITLLKKDADHFTVNVRVAVSRQFLAWVMALGEDARIVGPEPVLLKIDQEIDRLARQYRSTVNGVGESTTPNR